jgi:hypothetical protein
MWTEGPFIALGTLATWLAMRSEPEPRTGDVVLLGVLCGAAVLTRYIGVVLVVALGVWLLTNPGSWKRRIGRASLLGTLAAVGPAAWLLRNWLVAGTALGGRGSGSAGLATNARNLLTNLSIYLGTSQFGDWGRAIAALVLIGIPLAALVVWCWRRRDGRPGSAELLIPAVFVLAYAILLVVLASWTPVAQLVRTRFGAPLWIPLISLAIPAAAAVWQRWPQPAWRAVLAAALIFYTGSGLIKSAKRVRLIREIGVHGINRSKWSNSELIEGVRRANTGQVVVTNRPHALYLHTSIPVRYSPRGRNYRSTEKRSDDVAELRERAAREGSVPFAWFWDFQGGYGYFRPRQLARQELCMVVDGQFSDGVLFEVLPDERCPRQRSASPDSPAPEAPR